MRIRMEPRRQRSHDDFFERVCPETNKSRRLRPHPSLGWGDLHYSQCLWVDGVLARCAQLVFCSSLLALISELDCHRVDWVASYADAGDRDTEKLWRFDVRVRVTHAIYLDTKKTYSPPVKRICDWMMPQAGGAAAGQPLPTRRSPCPVVRRRPHSWLNGALLKPMWPVERNGNQKTLSRY